MPFRADPLILDAPLWRHIPVFCVWLVYQASIFFEASKLDHGREPPSLPSLSLTDASVKTASNALSAITSLLEVVKLGLSQPDP